MAVDKLPGSVDLSEDLRDAETHRRWARRVADPYRGNLEACPKPEGAVVALLKSRSGLFHPNESSRLP